MSAPAGDERPERAQPNTGPTFCYIGTSKSGSTWLFNALAQHPQVYLASSKGLYFFDQHYDRGADWYVEQFAAGADRRARGEISHSYLSSGQVPERIAALNPQMRLLASLREPVDRAFSDYLDLVKNGQHDGSFATALERFPRLIDRGRYSTHLHRYLACFPAGQLHIGLFDDLRTDAQGYADQVFGFLGVEPLALPSGALRSRMPAGVARSPALAGVAKTASRLVLRLGLHRLRSRVKRSTLLRRGLYRSYADEERPTADPEVAADLHRLFAPEVAALDTLLGRPVGKTWGYSPPGDGTG